MHVLTIRCLFVVCALFVLNSTAFSFSGRSNEASRYGCGQSKRCSLVISALRNPRHLSAWNTEAWTKAIGQLHAYQQLFSNDDSQFEHEKRSIDAEIPQLRAGDELGYDPYYWMLEKVRRR